MSFRAPPTQFGLLFLTPPGPLRREEGPWCQRRADGLRGRAGPQRGRAPPARGTISRPLLFLVPSLPKLFF